MIRFDQVGVRVPTIGVEPHQPGYKDVLIDISVELAERRIAIVGPNGSGKSTLLRLINGLAVASSGRVDVHGCNPATDGSKVRRQVGFVFTDPLSQLVMPTPAEDIELSLRRVLKSRSARRDRARTLLADFGVAHVADQSIYDLSGGERQLVALVSVLAIEPAIVVADEPTTLLDLRNKTMMRRVFAELPQQLVIATHDLDLAADTDRVLVIDDGRIIADGEPSETLAFYTELMTR